MIRFFSLVAALCLVIGSADLVQAQDNQALIDKIDRLERDIRTMERLVYRGDVAKPKSTTGSSTSSGASSGGGSVGDTELRMSDIEGQMRKLTGNVEEVDNRIAQLEQRFEKLLRDLDLRLREIEQRLAGTPAPANTSAAGTTAPKTAPKTLKAPAPAKTTTPARTSETTTAAAVQLPDGTPEDKYNFAMNLLRTHKYDQAEGAFTAFLDQHGKDRLAGHAKYWLGETYYVRQNYDAAAKTYLTGYQEFPESAKAPDMLLKLSVTLGILGENSEACIILEELGDRFPDATSAIRTRAKRERKKAGCS
jgi:tol-pal system protein YbgF